MTMLYLCLLLFGNFVAGVVSFILYAKFDKEYEESDINLLGVTMLFGYAFLLCTLLALFLQLVGRLIKRFI